MKNNYRSRVKNYSKQKIVALDNFHYQYEIHRSNTESVQQPAMWKTLPRGGACRGCPRNCAEQSLFLPILKIYPGSILHQNYRVKVVRRWQFDVI